MIDGIKTGYLPLDVERLSAVLGVALNRKTVYAKQNGLIFGFSEEVDKDTGELRYMCGVRGSVHKYANRGTHNADAFRMSDLCRVLTELREVYTINPDTTRLYSVEFGVNIKLPYDPRRVLDAIRMYKGFEFEPMGKIGLSYKADSYKLKIYDKGRQCGVPGFDNVLRIEVRATGTYLRKRRVYVPVLGDLLSADIWERFEALLLEMIDNTVIVEAVNVEALTSTEQELFALFAGDGWQLLDKVKRCRKKKKFLVLAERIGAMELKKYLKGLVLVECKSLRDMDLKKCNPDGVLHNDNETIKINNSNNICHQDNAENATETAFYGSAPKDEKCNRNGFKIKGVLVTHSTPQTVTTFAAHEAPQCIAKLSHIVTLEFKARGRPPNRDPITMPLKRVLTNQNQLNEQRRIYSNRLHNQFRNRTMCGRAIRSARLLFLHNKQHRQRDIPSH